MPRQFTLGRSERLKGRKNIEHIFSEGKNFPLAPFRVYYILKPVTQAAPSRLQFGTGVSSKTFKKAKDRNRIKRLIRECYRVQKLSLLETLRERNLQMDLFFIYSSRDLPEYAILKEKMGQVLLKLEKLANS